MENAIDQLPTIDGLRYFPAFCSSEEESEMLALFQSMTFRKIVMRGQTASRTVACFGFDYVYSRRDVQPTEPFPPLVESLARRAEVLVGEGSHLYQAIVTSYPPGAGINWHVDAPIFGPGIVGISFGSHARLMLKRGSIVHRMMIAPGSAYVLSGEVRYEWAHRIAPVPSHRYSVTFRSIPRVEETVAGKTVGEHR